MRIIEIILPKNTTDKSLSFQAMQKIDMLQKRMDRYVDRIVNANTSPAGREFLKSKLKSDYHELRSLIPQSREISEAVHKLPLTPKDFELIKKLMEKPIPAIIAAIYISEVIDDDELNDQFRSFEETDPGRDIRPLIVEWIRRVMPDQMYQFTGEVANHKQKMGILSPLHGYDPHMYKGAGMTGTESSGNAYGRA